VGTSKVAVIGELNVDVVAAGLAGPPTPGEEILARDCRLVLGSASAIFACGVAKLGHPVTFISKVGRDDFGDFCLKELRDVGIRTGRVARDGGVRTGVTISLSTKRDRSLVTYLGAIGALAFDELPLAALKGHSHLHMTSFFLQDRLRAHFPEIFARARSLGLKTSFDPNSDPSQAWGADIWRVLERTDVLFLNEKEALQLTGRATTRKALERLGEAVPCAVVKRGRKGAVAMRGGEVASARGFDVACVDTTGAGDSFASGFVSAYLEKASLEDCLERGNACGALSTLGVGGTERQPDRSALERFLEEQRG
jgi:sugar/nucleoside kinase (ribokinase family)